jgi:hypothetical protein
VLRSCGVQPSLQNLHSITYFVQINLPKDAGELDLRICVQIAVDFVKKSKLLGKVVKILKFGV